MNIAHLKPEYVLAALYNNSRPQGMGILQADGGVMTPKEAKQLLDETPDKYFDYLKDRVMKISLEKDEVATWLYNRDLGQGAAERVIEGLTDIEAIRA